MINLQKGFSQNKIEQFKTLGNQAEKTGLHSGKLTGFDDKKLQGQIDGKVTFKTFFQDAKLNINAHLVTGVICGYRIEEIDNKLTQQVRYLDKLVDGLAKGKKIEKILRKA